MTLLATILEKLNCQTFQVIKIQIILSIYLKKRK